MAISTPTRKPRPRYTRKYADEIKAWATPLLRDWVNDQKAAKKTPRIYQE